MVGIIVTILITVLFIFGMYKVYFKKLFEERKYYRSIEKSCKNLTIKKASFIVDPKAEANFKKLVESSQYRFSLDCTKFTSDHEHILIDGSRRQQSIDKNSIKSLADARIASRFNKNKYYVRYDEGRLVISDNIQLNNYVAFINAKEAEEK